MPAGKRGMTRRPERRKQAGTDGGWPRSFELLLVIDHRYLADPRRRADHSVARWFSSSGNSQQGLPITRRAVLVRKDFRQIALAFRLHQVLEILDFAVHERLISRGVRLRVPVQIAGEVDILPCRAHELDGYQVRLEIGIPGRLRPDPIVE